MLLTFLRHILHDGLSYFSTGLSEYFLGLTASLLKVEDPHQGARNHALEVAETSRQTPGSAKQGHMTGKESCLRESRTSLEATVDEATLLQQACLASASAYQHERLAREEDEAEALTLLESVRTFESTVRQSVTDSRKQEHGIKQDCERQPTQQPAASNYSDSKDTVLLTEASSIFKQKNKQVLEGADRVLACIQVHAE